WLSFLPIRPEEVRIDTGRQHRDVRDIEFLLQNALVFRRYSKHMIKRSAYVSLNLLRLPPLRVVYKPSHAPALYLSSPLTQQKFHVVFKHDSRAEGKPDQRRRSV